MRGHGLNHNASSGVGRGRGALQPAWMTRKENNAESETKAHDNRGPKRSRIRSRSRSISRQHRNRVPLDSPPRFAPKHNGHFQRRQKSSFVPPLYSIWKGKVSNLQDFGCFVTMEVENGETVDGLVHISQITDQKQRVEDVGEFVQTGTQVYVKVIEHRHKPDTDRVQLALSMKYVAQGSGTDLDPNNAKLEMEMIRKRDAPTDNFRAKQNMEAVHRDVLELATFSANGVGRRVNCKYSGGSYEMVNEQDVENLIQSASGTKATPQTTSTKKESRRTKRSRRERSRSRSRQQRSKHRHRENSDDNNSRSDKDKKHKKKKKHHKKQKSSKSSRKSTRRYRSNDSRTRRRTRSRSRSPIRRRKSTARSRSNDSRP